MIVLSLFDGMSCGQVALKRAGIKVDTYFASEIDKYAISIAQKNYPETVQLGDIRNWKQWDIDLSSIDLLFAGFPCQAWSLAGKQKGNNNPRGKLVHDLINIWQAIKRVNPNLKFLFENVKMKKEFTDYINTLFGTKPILINSALVSAQNRQRQYWTNIPGVTQPVDKGILLKDIVHESCSADREKSYCITSSIGRTTPREYFKKNQGQMCFVDREKSYCIDANYYKGGSLENYLKKKRRQIVYEVPRGIGNNPTDYVRKLTPVECERLQTLPDGYTEGVSNTQRYKMIGNGWTVDVIAHLLKSLTDQYKQTWQEWTSKKIK